MPTRPPSNDPHTTITPSPQASNLNPPVPPPSVEVTSPPPKITRSGRRVRFPSASPCSHSVWKGVVLWSYPYYLYYNTYSLSLMH